MAQNIDELQRRLDTLMGKDLEVDVVDEPFRDKEMDYFETGLDYQFLLPELEKQRKSAINIQRYSKNYLFASKNVVLEMFMILLELLLRKI